LSNPRIIYIPHAGVMPEQARDARVRAFVFQCWHARKGDLHGLTSEAASKQKVQIKAKKDTKG
jgi:hypothetical protein